MRKTLNKLQQSTPQTCHLLCKNRTKAASFAPRCARRYVPPKIKRITLFFLLSWASLDTLACSCVPLSLPADILRYEFIFTGTVLKHDHAKWIDERLDRFEFEVSRSYKNDLGSKIVVYSHPSTSTCGFKFYEGIEYLVFANIPDDSGPGAEFYQKEGFPNVSLCSPTTPTAPSSIEMKRRKVMQFMETLAPDI